MTPREVSSNGSGDTGGDTGGPPRTTAVPGPPPSTARPNMPTSSTSAPPSLRRRVSCPETYLTGDDDDAFDEHERRRTNDASRVVGGIAAAMVPDVRRTTAETQEAPQGQAITITATGSAAETGTAQVVLEGDLAPAPEDTAPEAGLEYTAQVDLGEDQVAELRRGARRPRQQRRMSSFEVHRRRLETRHPYNLPADFFFGPEGLDAGNDDDDDGGGGDRGDNGGNNKNENGNGGDTAGDDDNDGGGGNDDNNRGRTFSVIEKALRELRRFEQQ